MGLDSSQIKASAGGDHNEPEAAVRLGTRGGLQYLGHARSGGKDGDPQQEVHLLHPQDVLLLAAGQGTREQVESSCSIEWLKVV